MVLKKLQKGLTLTEILIVIAIISFLVILALIAFRNQIFKGNDAKRKGDIHKIQVAVEEYEKDHNCYPLPQLLTCSPGTGLQPYLDKIPCDPTTKASYYYDYDVSSCPQWYRLFANLENTSDPDAYGTCGPGGTYNYYASSPNAPSCQLTEIQNLYGCKSNLCIPILWDETRPGPECDPNFQSITCFGQCGNPAAECIPWK